MIYFDHAAASLVDSEMAERFRELLIEYPGNPESIHAAGRRGKKAMENAARELGETLGGKNFDALFFASGTDIFRFLGFWISGEKGVVVTTGLEHPALLAQLGEDACRIGVSAQGKVSLDDLAEQLDERTKLVAIHQVNSEIGVIQDIAAISALVREKAPRAAFFADTIQSVGKLADAGRGAGLFSVSGHKLGCPGGAALIFDRTRYGELVKTMERFRHQFYHAGRVEPPVALLLAETAKKQLAAQIDKRRQVESLYNELRSRLPELKLKNNGTIQFTVDQANGSPYILHFLVPGYESAVLLRFLSGEGIMVSSGSACQAESKTPSRTLVELGVPVKLLYSGLRLSFAATNTPDEGKQFLKTFQKILENY